MGFRSDVKADFEAVFDKDPAANSRLEVLLTYPGFHAVFCHRCIHILYKLGIPLLPRFLSHCVRFLTGIEIHPAAKIGPGLVIDHGMGVVIGETSEVGEGCLIYQGVTLGGTGKEKGKRHPTLGKNVVVGAGAKILGSIRVGDYVKIGANSVVLHPVPDYGIVVGVPGRVIKKKILRVEEEGLIEVCDQRLPDPVDEKFRAMETRISELAKKIEKIEGKTTAMRIYNTMSGKKEDFVPITPGEVGIYACGVTVYDKCHIGHARSSIVFDVIRRYFKYKGLSVKFVKNFTDIDDKIIKRSALEGIPWDKVAEKYTVKYTEDMTRLGVEPADVEPKATEHIKEIIEIVKGLIDKGFAYELNGDVYYAVEKFPEYGKLSGRRLSDMLAGARVEVDDRKRNPMDFALWKSSKPGEPSWESPWGLGRPGWHIECSAMSLKHLGESFDIHGGGADLIFPHHENEIAQSEAFTGANFVKYWVHNGFITVDKEKMSKSLGNFFTIEDILDKFDPEVVRFFLLSTHYRSPIEFSDEQLKEAESSLERYYTTLGRLDEYIASAATRKACGKTKEADTAFKDTVTRSRQRFEEAMDDDFNTALALGHAFEFIRELNRYLDLKPSDDKTDVLLMDSRNLLSAISGVLNVFGRTPLEWFSSFVQTKKLEVTEGEILKLIEDRREARKNKDWARADVIRKELEEKGIILEDKKDGTIWKVKTGLE